MMKVEIKDGKLFIEIPITPKESSSGKSIVIASSSGNHATTATFEGKPVIVGLNAYTKK